MLAFPSYSLIEGGWRKAWGHSFPQNFQSFPQQDKRGFLLRGKPQAVKSKVLGVGSWAAHARMWFSADRIEAG